MWCCGHCFSADCDGLCGVVNIVSVRTVMGCVVLWTLFQCGLCWGVWCCGHCFSAGCDGLCGVVDIVSVRTVMGCVVLWTLFQCGL